MTFGTARTPAEVPDYLASVRGGREVPPELVDEFRRRFERVGGSPLIEITQQQALALGTRLTQMREHQFIVRCGMRHSAPWIREALGELQEAGADRVIGIILSPQY